MDLPTIKGVTIDSPYDKSSGVSLSRHAAVKKLVTWGSSYGVVSRDTVSFAINENGQIKCIANHFIPAKKHILHVPFKFDISFGSLKAEVHPDKAWIGWTDLKARIKAFEETFQWSPYNFDQKDYFSKNLLLSVCILGVLHKLDLVGSAVVGEIGANNSSSSTNTAAAAPSTSFMLQVFHYYWHAIVPDVGCVLFNWSPMELACLQGSSFSSCLPDAKRFGEEIYSKVVQPFVAQHPELFGSNVTLEKFLRVNSVILTQSFGSGKKEKSKLLPIIDLVNGKPNDMHNCTLENCAIQTDINGEFIKFHVLESFCDIHAGDEIILEYAQVGNGDYLMTYNHIPLDPEVIMNNQRTEVYLDLSEFLETELLRMHPNNPTIRKLKRQHIYGFFNLPKYIPITMEDLFSAEYSCIPSLRQVLIFIQFDENDAVKAIKTSRIKSQLNPHQLHFLFHLFLKFIECSLEKPAIDLYKALLGKPLPQSVITAAGVSPIASDHNVLTTGQLSMNMRSAIYLQMSERLVVEVMINRFINLFPENFHELGYSIMRDHLVSAEVNGVLEEICKPLILARFSQCLVCGSVNNVSKCSRCRRAYYCSAACQKEHWTYHRTVCKPPSANNAKDTTKDVSSTNNVPIVTSKA